MAPPRPKVGPSVDFSEKHRRLTIRDMTDTIFQPRCLQDRRDARQLTTARRHLDQKRALKEDVSLLAASLQPCVDLDLCSGSGFENGCQEKSW